jgi:hypothetical protein
MRHMSDHSDDRYEQARDDGLIPIRKIAEDFRIPEQRHPTVHHLKCRCLFYEDILSGKKTFEIRRNDRNYQVGDILMLKEWDDTCDMEDGHFTGREVQRLVVYMTGFEQKPGYVVMGITR